MQVGGSLVHLVPHIACHLTIAKLDCVVGALSLSATTAFCPEVLTE
jgi:hypothetical protein